jgi:hypothetical protein
MEVQMQFHEQFLMIEAMKEIHAQPRTKMLERVSWRVKLSGHLIDLAKRLEPNVSAINSIREFKSNR